MGIHGNAASVPVLDDAGVKTADLLIAVTNADELNLLCCMTAHVLNNKIHTIARIRNPEYYYQIYSMRDSFALSLTVNPELQAAHEIERLLLLLKNLRRNIHKIIHPQRIQAVRVNGRTVNERVLDNTNSYLAAYVLIVVTSFMVISLDGFSVTTNFSAVMACFNNIGPGLVVVGPICNYAGFSPLSKFVLIADMLAG